MSSLDRRLSQVLFRLLSAAYFLRSGRNETPIGVFLHQGGALFSLVVHQPSVIVGKTGVQTMVAKWRQFFDGLIVVSGTIRRFTNQTSRGLCEDAKKGAFESLRKPIIIGRDGEI